MRPDNLQHGVGEPAADEEKQMKRMWWMGILSGVGLTAVLTVSGGALLAQNNSTATTGRIATIDVLFVFNEYQRQKDLTGELRNAQTRLEGESVARKNRLDSLQATLDAMTPTDPALAEKTREFLQAQFEFKNWSDLVQADMAREVSVWTVKVYNEILEATALISQEKGYDAVFFQDKFRPASYDPDVIRKQILNRKLIFASPSTDMTQAVLDELNTRYRAQPQQPMLKLAPIGAPPSTTKP